MCLHTLRLPGLFHILSQKNTTKKTQNTQNYNTKHVIKNILHFDQYEAEYQNNQSDSNHITIAIQCMAICTGLQS